MQRHHNASPRHSCARCRSLYDERKYKFLLFIYGLCVRKYKFFLFYICNENDCHHIMPSTVRKSMSALSVQQTHDQIDVQLAMSIVRWLVL